VFAITSLENVLFSSSELKFNPAVRSR
jgi:hypothetical protein